MIRTLQETRATLTLDYQDKLADASQSDWLTQMMKAQANFTRDVVSAVSEASRSTLKK